MNKKVVLSVLSATVVASMAASAFAAPSTGVYIGGNVKHFYSFDNLLDLSAEGLAQYKADMSAIGTDFDNIVYVDLNKKGASIAEILAAPSLSDAVKDPLKVEDFSDLYTVMDKDGKSAGSYDARKDVDDQPATGDLKVESVSAINAATLTIKFGAEVEATTATNPAYYLIDGGTLAAAGLTTADLTLSEDGKTVTVDLSSIALTNNTTYRVQVTDDITDKAGTKIAAYDQLFNFADATAPTVVSSNYNAATSLFTIKFSEPLAAGAAAKVKVLDKNNTDVTSTRVALSGDGKSLTIDSSVATALTADETYRVVMLGATDLVGNYFANNKVEASFKVAKTEEVKPTVTSLTAKNPTTVRVTFSEPVFVDGTSGDQIAELSINGAAAVPVTAETTLTPAVGEALDVNGDGKTWDIVVHATTGLTGVNKISLVNFVDLQSNTQATAYEKFLSFAADQAAPALVSSSTAGTKLYLTFDEATVLDDTDPVTVLTPDNVELSVPVAFGTTLANYGSDTKTVVIDLGANISKAGSYTVTIPAGMVEDAGTNSQAYTVTKSFTPADTVKPTLLMSGSPATVDANAVVQTVGAPSEVVVTFSEKVDGTALNVANYKVNGAEVFSKAVFSGDTNKVKLTVKPGAIDLDGTYVVTVANIKDLAGNVMNQQTAEENLLENVAPVVAGAELTAADKIALTFSEVVANDDATDFEVTIDGAKVGFTYATGVITLDSAITDPTKPIVVKVVTASDIADTNGTKIVGNVTKPVTVTQ